MNLKFNHDGLTFATGVGKKYQSHLFEEKSSSNDIEMIQNDVIFGKNFGFSSFVDFPFDLFKLTRDQKISIKNLVNLDKISAEFKDKVCNICQKDFGNFKSMRAHQTFMHFKILRQYRDQYGKLFENFLSTM